MPVPKFVCEVSYAFGFASSMDGDVPRSTRSIAWKTRPNSITLEKGNLRAHMRETQLPLSDSHTGHRTQVMRIRSKGKTKKTKQIRTAIRIVNSVSGILDGHFIGNMKGTSRWYWLKLSPNRFRRCVSSYFAILM